MAFRPQMASLPPPASKEQPEQPELLAIILERFKNVQDTYGCYFFWKYGGFFPQYVAVRRQDPKKKKERPRSQSWSCHAAVHFAMNGNRYSLAFRLLKLGGAPAETKKIGWRTRLTPAELAAKKAKQAEEVILAYLDVFTRSFSYSFLMGFRTHLMGFNSVFLCFVGTPQL